MPHDLGLAVEFLRLFLRPFIVANIEKLAVGNDGVKWRLFQLSPRGPTTSNKHGAMDEFFFRLPPTKSGKRRARSV